MAINFRFFRPSSGPSNRVQNPPANNRGQSGGPAKVPDKAPQLPPLNLDPSNPHGLQRAEGGRRGSIDRTDPDMTQFWNNQNHPAAFDNNNPVSNHFEALYWGAQNHQMRGLWGKEEKATTPQRPSAMEMQRRMQAGPGNESPLLESTIKSMPKESRDFFNDNHNWTADSLRKEAQPRQIETFGNFRFGGDAPVQYRPPSSADSTQNPPGPSVPPAHPRSEAGSGGFNTIIIPDLPG